MKRSAPSSSFVIPLERIQQAIFLLRGEKVMLDADLATLYGVETRALVQAVARNQGRFPEDFVFRLTPEEAGALRSQTVISNPVRGGRRYLPYAFTEQGVAMLSSVLRSTRAAEVNVAIMRAFVALRHLLTDHATLARKLAALEQKFAGHDQAIHSLFDALRELMTPPPAPKREIGFHTLPALRAARKSFQPAKKPRR